MEINREVLKSTERIRRRKFSYALSCLAIFVSAIFAVTNYLTHFDRLYLKKVYVSGNREINSDLIFGIVEKNLDGKYYGIYPKNNLLIYPKKEIENALENSLSWIARADVTATFGSISVNIMEREPKYFWCDDQSKPSIEHVCYYVDENGYVFDLAPKFSDHIYFEFYGGTKRSGFMRAQILPVETLRKIVSLKDSLNTIILQSGLLVGKIYGLYIYNNGDYDFLVDNKGHDWKINFNLTTDADKKYKAILESPAFIKELSTTDKFLEYIDLRFGKKVFYKFGQNI